VDNLSSLSADEQELQRKVLDASIDLYQLDPAGYSDPQAWQNMNDLLVQMGLMKQPLDVSTAFSNDYLTK
jgi:NitT/TauT family transport system substrate-binding protein